MQSIRGKLQSSGKIFLVDDNANIVKLQLYLIQLKIQFCANEAHVNVENR